MLNSDSNYNLNWNLLDSFNSNFKYLRLTYNVKELNFASNWHFQAHQYSDLNRKLTLKIFIKNLNKWPSKVVLKLCAVCDFLRHKIFFEYYFRFFVGNFCVNWSSPWSSSRKTLIPNYTPRQPNFSMKIVFTLFILFLGCLS